MSRGTYLVTHQRSESGTYLWTQAGKTRGEQSMEYCEVFRRDGTGTGRIVEKHAPRKSGDYFRHTLVVIKTMDSPEPGEGEGSYIVQQRSLKARYYAGKWDVTGGSVRAGETPLDAIIREIREEIHLQVAPEALRLVYEDIIDWPDGSGMLISMFACRASVSQEGLSWDTYEVNDVRIFPYHEFRAFLMDHNSEKFGKALDMVEAEI